MFDRDGVQSYSFAKTPLKAAHAPLVTAKKSHADLVGGVDMLRGSALACREQCCEMDEIVAATAGTGPPRA